MAQQPFTDFKHVKPQHHRRPVAPFIQAKRLPIAIVTALFFLAALGFYWLHAQSLHTQSGTLATTEPQKLKTVLVPLPPISNKTTAHSS